MTHPRRRRPRRRHARRVVVRRAARERDERHDRERRDHRDDQAPRLVHGSPPQIGSRSTGQVMQWPPPRPLPSSNPSIVDDLDAGLAHLRDRERVALVGDDDAGLEGDDVVAVVPLLALLLVRVAAGLDDVELRHAERVGDGAEEVSSSRTSSVAAASCPGRRLIARMPVDDLRIRGRLVAVEQREHRVEVHVRPVLGHDGGDDPLGGALGEQRLGDLLDHPARSSARTCRSATVPLPMGSTSPPSSDASPKSSIRNRLVVAQRRVPELEVARRRTSGGRGRSPPRCRPRAGGRASTSG